MAVDRLLLCTPEHIVALYLIYLRRTNCLDVVDVITNQSCGCRWYDTPEFDMERYNEKSHSIHTAESPYTDYNHNRCMKEICKHAKIRWNSKKEGMMREEDRDVEVVILAGIRGVLWFPKVIVHYFLVGRLRGWPVEDSPTFVGKVFFNFGANQTRTTKSKL